ncbi:MAG TPA: NAD-dependent epimerase/dehydratase family protein [Longimicrobiaceae bacterium]|nr:NAD-dependent epimerase/dehydratase family protein [Longimicrobiaceae bacterium]
MRILVLGGTQFVGRHLVAEALERGHEVTLFHRGEHGAELFPGVERIRGDRERDLGALRGRRWDAVVDTSAYVPRVARSAAEALRDAVERYVFVSTISVYRTDAPLPLREDSPLVELEDPTVEEVTGETYGGLKALCERAVEETLPGRTLVVRPGLIVGPDDYTDRFPYWPRRVAEGGEVLAPGGPGRFWQFVDVRDLGAWTVRMAEAGRTGTFNVDGPLHAWSAGEVLETCREVGGSGARLTWVRDAFLLEQGVQPWTDLPFWIPEGDTALGGAYDVAVDRALAEGLVFRPLAETVRDTLAWDRARPEGERGAKGFGMPREREREVLEAWRRAR